MGHRNSILHLLEIYELLLKEEQTFNSLRKKIRIGYHPLKGLIDKLLEDEYIHQRIIDDITYYSYTKKLIELFQGSFYESVKELKDI